MDFTSYTSIRNKVAKSPNLCEIFKLLSIETWKRIEYAYLNPKVKVFETTLTQNLIFSINAFKDQFNLDIEIFEAEDERTNGNDLEIIIKFPNDGVEFYAPIQAKKVSRDGKYYSMEHGNQIENLVDYASNKRAQAFYLLYNFSNNFPSSSIVPTELNGCTLVPAIHLINCFYQKKPPTKKAKSNVPRWKIPTIVDLHPVHAFPLHQLICPSSPDQLRNFLFEKIDAELTYIYDKQSDISFSIDDLRDGFFEIDTIKNDGWVSISEKKQSLNKKVKQEKEQNSTAFKPRSKIIITQLK